MNNDPAKQASKHGAVFADRVGAKATRKLKARRRSPNTIWLGFGVMGLIGWSVVVPTLFGAMLGLWLDKHYPGKHAWTLALLAAGLAIGCFNAWNWVAKEDRAMHEEQEDAHE
ncbi:F0F1 ATP synthase subunit [Capsulimonas corticalis]|uniref:F0F1 ATP synthase subunit n=1 Tax=Capsulimonas corticalis TaxID=2219043 RepID=A0A402CY05_9BACT|nr:AtpZ/AtpI family protein [Capsulimonas corticalis]BDI32110.1 F0F1 ATP synthase subunit [Capsulimonas corticalis]